MELPHQDQEIVSREYAKRTMVGYFLVYTLLVALPLLLIGHGIWAFFAEIVFVTFAYANPKVFAPSKSRLKQLMYNDSHDQMRCDNPMGRP